MRRVASIAVAVVAVLSSGVAFASSDAVADLQTQLHALAKNAKPAVASAPARSIDLGVTGVNVSRDARTGGDLATTSSEQNAAATPAGVHH